MFVSRDVSAFFSKKKKIITLLGTLVVPVGILIYISRDNPVPGIRVSCK